MRPDRCMSCGTAATLVVVTPTSEGCHVCGMPWASRIAHQRAPGPPRIAENDPLVGQDPWALPDRLRGVLSPDGPRRPFDDLIAEHAERAGVPVLHLERRPRTGTGRAL